MTILLPNGASPPPGVRPTHRHLRTGESAFAEADVPGVGGTVIDPAKDPDWMALPKIRPMSSPKIRQSSLNDAKRVAVSTVNGKIRKVFAGGFLFKGITLSASLEAQAKWAAMHTVRDALTYPFLVPSVDDKDFVEMVNADDVHDAYTACVLSAFQALQAATQMKKNIQEASSKDEIADAINRGTP